MIKKHTFDKLCDKFKPQVKDGEQWLHLIQRLLWHKVNILGQHHLFSDLEYSIIHNTARREAELLLLPVVQNLPIKTLALEAGARGGIFEYFKYEDIQAEVARLFRARYRHDASFYDSCVYLMWEYQIYQTYLNMLVELYHSNPIAKNTIGLAFGECLTISDQDNAYKDLKQSLMSKANFRIPVDEKESLIDVLLGEWIAKLREMPFYMCYEASYTDTVIWRKIAKKVKTASEKQWQSMINLGNIQEPEAPESKTMPKLDDTQRKLLNRAYGKSADKAIEVYLNDPDATVQEIAEEAGVSEKTVKRIRAEIRKKGKEKFSTLL